MCICTLRSNSRGTLERQMKKKVIGSEQWLQPACVPACPCACKRACMHACFVCIACASVGRTLCMCACGGSGDMVCVDVCLCARVGGCL